MKLVIGLVLAGPSFDQDSKELTLPFDIFGRLTYLMSSGFVDVVQKQGFNEFAPVVRVDEQMEKDLLFNTVIRQSMDEWKPDWILLISFDPRTFNEWTIDKCAYLFTEEELDPKNIYGFPQRRQQLFPYEYRSAPAI